MHIQSLASIDDVNASMSKVPLIKGGLSFTQFYSFLNDIRWQPPFRADMDKCADYYDGNQLDAETLEALRQKGMGPLIKNVIAPVVNVVLGMEAKTRTDWRVLSDSDMHADVAEAESIKLKEAERETRADRACSDAYAGQVKAGLHWVEVSRALNPFDYRYRVQAVHRREIFWDWRAKSPDLSDARYIVRKRWYELEEAIAFFPEHETILRAAMSDPYRYQIMRQYVGTVLGQAFDVERALDLEDFEMWRMFERQRLALYECWTRSFVRGKVFYMPDGQAFEFNAKNQMHVAMMNRGMIKVESAVFPRLAMSIWAGPHKLFETGVDPKRMPYVPFWGYREDRTGVPYGLIRSMLSPQDEVNARRQKMMWMLGAKRVQMDSDALDTKFMDVRAMLNEIARPDAVVMLNPSRTNRDAFMVDDNLALAKEQYLLSKDAEESVQAVAGVFNALLGRESSTTANSAINTLVDQGTTALAEINDNYRFARRLVGEKLHNLVTDDMIGRRIDVVTDRVGKKKVISLNVPAQDPNTGMTVLQNDVKGSVTKVALDDIPSTASYRQQQFTMLSEVMKGMAPELQAAIAPFWMEASDMQSRREMADAIRKALGQNVEPQDEQEAQAMQAAQAEQQQVKAIQMQEMQLALAEREAKINEINAKAEQMRRPAEGNPELDQARAEFDAAIAEEQRKAREQVDRLSAELMTLRNGSALREQTLVSELGKLAAKVEAATASQRDEVRKAEIEKEIARINADKERDVAKIAAASDEAIRKMGEQIDKVRDDLLKRLDKERADDEKRDAATLGKAGKPEEKAEPAAPAPVNVQVTIEQGAIQVGGGTKTIKIERQADGSLTGESKSD